MTKGRIPLILLILRLSLCLSLIGYGLIGYTSTGEKPIIRHGIPIGFKQLYPEADGIIWTDTFVKHIFEDLGFTVETFETPPKRAPYLISNGQLDSFLSTNDSLGKFEDQFLQSEFPGASLAMYIYYNNTRDWEPTWPPDDIFKSKKGRTKQSPDTLRNTWQLNILQASSFDACAKMVNAGRTDYWIDNVTGFTNSTPGLIRYQSEEYTYRELYRWPIYIFFQPNDRGRELKALYDRAIKDILLAGRYLTIFYQYDNNFYNDASGRMAVKQIREQFPHFNFPEQDPVDKTPLISK